VAKAVKKAMAHAPDEDQKLVVLYDGRCPVCVKFVEMLLRRAQSAAVEAVDLHSDRVRREFPQFSKEELMRELHAIDGRGNVYVGAAAVAEILRRQKWPVRALAILWRVPGYSRLARALYRWFASRRYCVKV